ncbi:MFS transporter [Colwellia psychrerythraea]|uniref:Putative membrane protein n=1 Tax=Colwellia psychrerythraea (strain 34H / ATCC BAA-681) TaxID=167879 RepID=Q485S1_COLP3|nr:MFS transporter [Colwellia psychrerythraea]AAZ24520.1 putative membrane protein [Colwellia psychrerythraea 34H]
MSQTKRSPFQRSFYVANTMEIFERLAWYGMYTLLASYIMTPSSQGGLGLGNTERGLIMGVVPFFLYLFPVISGALADRFGYRKMFLLSFILMAPSYYFLGYAKDLTSFMSIFMLIALGAGIFKPVVTATISRTTDDTNRGLGFGIFYMMVNIGGFLGPVLAPIIQKHYGWQWVFIFACIWISVNFIPALFFYKEPERHAKNKTLKQVFQEMQQVLGNFRLALLVVPLLVLLVAFYAGFIGAQSTLLIVIFLVISAAVWDITVAKYSAPNSNKVTEHDLLAPVSLPWYLQKMRIGNKPFMIYLLILTGFWTVYMQIFVTLPVYIRDFVDSSDLVSILHSLSPWLHDVLTSVNIDILSGEISRLAEYYREVDIGQSPMALQEVIRTFSALDVRIPEHEIIHSFAQLNQMQLVTDPSAEALSKNLAIQWSTQYRQMNPATILSIDFLMIIIFQIAISHVVDKFKALPALIVGTAILSVSMLMQGFAHGLIFGGLFVCCGVMVFAVGEMISAPKSQEYVASFAPKDKAAMFMGYYFVSMALGNLFAGLLSGWLYGYFASQLSRPEWMWAIIACLGFVTCIAFYFFNKHFISDIQKQQLAQKEQSLSVA